MDELSEAFEQQMLKHMYSQKSRVNMAITTGSTPVKGYKLLSRFVKGKNVLTTCITMFLTNSGIKMIL